MKKAQGISMTTIVVAAIALLVLVVLSVIFIGNMGDWITKAKDCTNKGGICVEAGEPCNGIVNSDFRCKTGEGEPEQQCCMPIETS